jgi:hypothetical protein
MKIHSLEAETDRHTDMIRQTVMFCNYVDVPNKETLPSLMFCDEDTCLNSQFTKMCF